MRKEGSEKNVYFIPVIGTAVASKLGKYVLKKVKKHITEDLSVLAMDQISLKEFTSLEEKKKYEMITQFMFLRLLETNKEEISETDLISEVLGVFGHYVSNIDEEKVKIIFGVLVNIMKELELENIVIDKERRETFEGGIYRRFEENYLYEIKANYKCVRCGSRLIQDFESEKIDGMCTLCAEFVIRKYKLLSSGRQSEKIAQTIEPNLTYIDMIHKGLVYALFFLSRPEYGDNFTEEKSLIKKSLRPLPDMQMCTNTSQLLELTKNISEIAKKLKFRAFDATEQFWHIVKPAQKLTKIFNKVYFNLI